MKVTEFSSTLWMFFFVLWYYFVEIRTFCCFYLNELVLNSLFLLRWWRRRGPTKKISSLFPVSLFLWLYYLVSFFAGNEFKSPSSWLLYWLLSRRTHTLGIQSTKMSMKYILTNFLVLIVVVDASTVLSLFCRQKTHPFKSFNLDEKTTHN